MYNFKNDPYQGGPKINHLDFRPIEIKIEPIVPIKFIEIPPPIRLPNSMIPPNPPPILPAPHPPHRW